MAAFLELAAPPLLLLPPPRRIESVACLPDVLRDNLDVVFAGTAAGRRSARQGVYYAGRGNAFWPTLRQVGLLPPRFVPGDFAKLQGVGIGFTDLCKSDCGMDHDVVISAEDIAAFDAKMRQHQPRAIAFTSKKAASLWLHRRTDRIRYGHQKRRAGDLCEVFVLTSPSSAARRYWKIDPWRELADWLRATKPWRF
ncbi:MAG: mismatch-specific DNA-glycosylase [Hyphomicrobium sp.]